MSQSRAVFGNAEAWSLWGLDGVDSDSLAALDFGLFEVEISIEAGGSDSWSRVFATQNSEIQTGHFSIHGSSTARDLEVYEDFNGAAGRVYSDFEVLFEVSTPTPFSLVGTLAATYGYWLVTNTNIASLQLDRDGAPYLFFNIDIDGETAVNEGGILEPGALSLPFNPSGHYLTYWARSPTPFLMSHRDATLEADESLGCLSATVSTWTEYLGGTGSRHVRLMFFLPNDSGSASNPSTLPF